MTTNTKRVRVWLTVAKPCPVCKAKPVRGVLFHNIRAHVR